MARSKGIARRSSGYTTAPKWATYSAFASQPSPAWVPNVPFRFLHLPSEIRLSIYEYILPHGLEINISRNHTALHAKTSENAPRVVARWRSQKPVNTSGKPDSWRLGSLVLKGTLSLFLVSKFVSSEARGMHPRSSLPGHLSLKSSLPKVLPP